MKATRTTARRATLVTLVLTLVLTVLGTWFGGTATAAGADPFRAGETYRGDFPDPDIRRFGDTYYAYSTTIASKNLPVLTSPDLVTWTARPSHVPGQWWNNDAMPRVGRWAFEEHFVDVWRAKTWAPSVAQVRGGYVAAYSARLKDQVKWCISVARSTSPLGVFTDSRPRPLICPRGQGVIDPQLFVAPSGAVWLLWKTEGRKGSTPTKLWTRRMNARGTAFKPGSRPKALLQTARGKTWEGNVIENPAMHYRDGRYYLFYSGNRYVTGKYAIGYAICEGPKGPCARPAAKPLLATGGAVAGPGGGTPVTGPDGELRLGYAAWDRGRVGYSPSNSCKQTAAGCNQRRLHVATLKVGKRGKLHAIDRG